MTSHSPRRRLDHENATLQALLQALSDRLFLRDDVYFGAEEFKHSINLFQLFETQGQHA